MCLLANNYATFSKRFIIANMNRAESKQRMMNTPQTIHKGRSPQRYPPTLTSLFPIAVAPNHPPIIKPLYLGGATFDTKEIPIGDNRSSPNVRMR